MRATLLRLDDEHHVLLLMVHHAVGDAWSFGVLYRELSRSYAASLAGASSPLPPLPVQYGDYAAWQREHLRGATLERQVGFWAGRLAGAPPLLELPTDRPRPALQTHRAGEVRVRAPRGAARAAARAGPARGRDAVHDLSGRARGAAAPPFRAGRRGGGNPHRRAHARGDGGADRLLRQHAGAADGPGRRPVVPGAAGAGAREHAGRLRAPGRPLREAAGGAADPAEPEPQLRLPGVDGAAQRGRRPAGAAGRARLAGGPEDADDAVRPDAGGRGEGGRRDAHARSSTTPTCSTTPPSPRGPRSSAPCWKTPSPGRTRRSPPSRRCWKRRRRCRWSAGTPPRATCRPAGRCTTWCARRRCARPARPRSCRTARER